MAGMLYDGTDLKNADSKPASAMCDGALARTLSATPTNPHQADSELAAAWDVGVSIKEAGDADPDVCAPAGVAKAP